ncbi:hypothetical protein FUAX_22910 [Fulvitalea axinellae]|uniref:Transporter n=1 Tax=Fulvitalea axinellae TaxID=1182444 RepID=A0AAU9D5T4_9BACT|nr:hypothetical protein FUAX_22910 [Fulvitalea axinellae]
MSFLTRAGFALVAVFLSVGATGALAQGCSDAGVCTAPGLSSGHTENEFRNFVSFEPTFGVGEEGTSVFSPSVVVGLALGKSTQVQLKVPYFVTSGDLGGASGIGDITVSAVRHLWNSGKMSMDATLGLRLPTGKTDLTDEIGGNDFVLPMVYQTGLGTLDLLAGVSMRYEKWLFAVGYQQPLSQDNKNTFLASGSETLSLPDDKAKQAKEYFSSKDLERAPDVVLRAERAFDIKSSSLSVGLLSVFHMGKDKVAGQDVDDSQGVTLNLSASWEYPVSDRVTVGVNAGTPLAVRKERPAGLTRGFVISPAVRIKF